jgi:H+/Cl- antiporter ClcA
MKEKTGNIIKLALFTVALGAFAGLVIWCFLKATAFCTDLLWVRLPEASQIPFIVVIVCAAGGLFTGIMHKLFGDYPEELSVVMGKIKKDK